MSLIMIEESKFWNVIGEPRDNVNVPSIINALRALNCGAILEFHRIMQNKIADAYVTDVATACLIIRGYISDDEFKDFRAWLVFNGRERYEDALNNADSIASWLNDDLVNNFDGSGCLLAATSAFEKFGTQDEFLDRYYSLGSLRFDPDEPLDIVHDEKLLRARCPSLFRRFWKGFGELDVR